MRRVAVAALSASVLAAVLIGTPPAQAGNPPIPVDDQLRNLALASTRTSILTPQLLARTTALSVSGTTNRLAELAKDPERRPDLNFCTLALCVGDPRLEGWAATGGIVHRVLFTARTGATLSGHIWATRSGPAKRPGVLIVNGSIIGFEQAYWWAAQVLAKAGYVVMTFDVQGEGASDQFGEKPDQGENLVAGSPPIGDGGGFYDGAVDALDFLVSGADRVYVPRLSRTSRTSHREKQDRRVAAGLNSPHNPLWRMLDRQHLGIAGHSYGAVAASYLAQYDNRLDAVVAWDALCVPHSSRGTELDKLLLPQRNSPGSILTLPVPAALVALPETCFGAPSTYPDDVRMRKPALGITGDYVLPGLFVDRPAWSAKSRASVAYSKARVDTGSITIRGASHVDWTFVAAVPVATLRGVDAGAWYTAAWFDKYLKDDPTADRRLLTRRWHQDAPTRAVDPSRDPNLISSWFQSRLDIHLRDGRRVRCENLREGCPDLVPNGRDCGPSGSFSYVTVATAPDRAANLIRRPCA